MKPDYKPVVITHLPLTKEKEEVFSIAKRSRTLIHSICEYSKELRKKNIKVFERYVNIIRTEAGYFCAFYDEDIPKDKKPENFKDKLQPFEGLDGRMKLALFDKEGEIIIEDAAIFVAKTFVPNPEKLPNVMFRDGDSKNLKPENLYWSE